MATAVLGGCPDPGRDGTGTPGADPTPTPVPGGRVAFGVIGGPPSLDPYSPVATDLTRALVRPLLPSLFRFSPEGDAVADLAVDIAETRRRATVTLVERQWSTGRRITARDVVASAARARPPSGFAGLRAEATGPFEIAFRPAGRKGVRDWAERLARSTYVLPRGRFRQGGPSSGPFELQRYVPGLKLVLARSTTWEGTQAYLERVTVFFVESLDIALELLDRGELAGAALPMSVNLDERLDEMGLRHDETLGWESIRLEFNRDLITEDQVVAVAERVDRDTLEKGFVRDDGRITNTLNPAPCCRDGAYTHPAGRSGDAPDEVSLAAPAGDELLILMQRALQIQLGRDDIDAELLVVPADRLYGRWRETSPAHAALLRVAGAPGAVDPKTPWFAVPLVHIETLVAWRDGEVFGLAVNPSLEGPLWNAESWFRNTG